MPQPLHIFEDSTTKSGIFCLFSRFSLDAAASSFFLFFFCENADFSGGESEMASLSSPESRIKAAAQPGIKNQARCAGRNQESRITGGANIAHRCLPSDPNGKRVTESVNQHNRKSDASAFADGANCRNGGLAARQLAMFLKGPNSAGSEPSGHVSIEGVVDLPPLGMMVLTPSSGCGVRNFSWYANIFCCRSSALRHP